MSPQKPSQSPSPSHLKGMPMKKRYYVQHLTQQIFVVRERLSANGAPGADDRIVRSFHILHDAYMYAGSMNDVQSPPQNGATLERGKPSETVGTTSSYTAAPPLDFPRE
jgi:hypothetical protein